MYEDRAALGAQTYTLPQVAAAPPMAQQPYDDGVKALEGLQYVKGQTEDYYKKVQALKSFMQDAHANLGLDVRVPDMSRPESIKLHQIYNDAISDIMQQGNLLKTSHQNEMIGKQMGYEMNPAIDPNAQAYDTLRHGVDYAPKGLEQGVIEINNKLQMPSQTQEEQDQKEEIYKNAVEHYTQLGKQYPDRKWKYDQQIAGLTPPTKGDFRPFAPRTTYQDRVWGRKVETAGNILKKITNLADGAHDSFRPDPNQLNPEGKPYLVSKEFYGQKIGDGVVAGWRTNPTTGETDLMFQDGRSVNVSSQDPRTLTSQLTKTDPNAIEEYAIKNKITDEYDQIDKNKLFGKDYQKLKESKLQESEKMKLTTGPAVDEMIKDLTSMENHWFTSNDTKVFGNIKIRKDSDGFVIENINQLPVPGKSAKDKQDYIAKHKSYKNDEAGLKALATFIIARGGHVEAYKEKRRGQVKPQNGTQVAPVTGQDNNDPLGILK